MGYTKSGVTYSLSTAYLKGETAIMRWFYPPARSPNVAILVRTIDKDKIPSKLIMCILTYATI